MRGCRRSADGNRKPPYEQLAFFEARLDDALRRDGSTTLLYGEPGIGKRACLAHGPGAARVRGFKIGVTTNYPFASATYASIAEACRTPGTRRTAPRPPRTRPMEGTLSTQDPLKECVRKRYARLENSAEPWIDLAGLAQASAGAALSAIGYEDSQQNERLTRLSDPGVVEPARDI